MRIVAVNMVHRDGEFLLFSSLSFLEANTETNRGCFYRYVVCEYWPRGNLIGNFTPNVQPGSGSASGSSSGASSSMASFMTVSDPVLLAVYLGVVYLLDLV